MSTPSRLDLVRRAICAGTTYGNITWKPSAERLVRQTPELQGLQPQGIKAMLRTHVRDGGSVDERHEVRSEYAEEHEYWYRAVIPCELCMHGLFIELILDDEDPVEPYVQIVNCHPQRHE